MIYKGYFLLFFLIYTYIHSTEYIYPVASINNETTILYIHQQNPMQIGLLLWDKVTGLYQQGLCSLFSPASLQILPSGEGFSFIDQGRLRIKYFNKRSPKTIDFYEPLYNFTVINWIDDTICYFSAQQGGRSGIFQCDKNGTIECLVKQKNKDCLYPQKVGDELFYIERTCLQKTQYHIKKRLYQDKSNSESELLYDFETMPIIFLTMISQYEGFVLAHQKTMSDTDEIMEFTYYHLKEQNNVWHRYALFSFFLPTFFLRSDNEDSLYESILPLLPHIYDDTIYFVDCSFNSEHILWPYLYTIPTKNRILLESFDKNHHNFTPRVFGDVVIVGGRKKYMLT